MKQCPKCEKMNSAYAETCKFCGYDIKWAPDDGSDYEEPPNFSAGESKFHDSATNAGKADLDDIYDQLDDIKGQLAKGFQLFDINMPFGEMVLLIVKFSLASIPAAIIMVLLSFAFWMLFDNFLFTAMLRSYGIH